MAIPPRQHNNTYKMDATNNAGFMSQNDPASQEQVLKFYENLEYLKMMGKVLMKKDNTMFNDLIRQMDVVHSNIVVKRNNKLFRTNKSNYKNKPISFICYKYLVHVIDFVVKKK